MHPFIHAAADPNKPAYVMAGSGEIVTYGQLEDRSNRIAQFFRAQGLRTGDHIALMLDNNPRFFEICWAAQRSGLYYTAMSTRLTPGEAAFIIGDCGAKLVIGSRALAETAAQLPALCPDVRDWFMTGGTIPGYRSLEEAALAMPASRIADEASGLDMLYSSGTTGRPKGIKNPLEPVPIETPNPFMMVVCGALSFSADMTYLSPAPLYHAAPLRFCMMVQRFGGTCVVMEDFDAEQFLRLIPKHRITHTQVVPTMFVRILKLPEDARQRYDMSSLEVAFHAAAPCPIPVKERMIEWWGPIISEYYAGTEGCGLTFCNSQEWLEHRGTVGKALAGKLRIVDDEGELVPTGDVGAIYFAEGRPFEYHNDKAKTASSVMPNGWATLGDIGYVDADGFLYLTDRRAFMIISGGVNIYPQEAENVLIEHPDVLDVAVFGVPSEEFGEEVKAVVQPRNLAAAGPELAARLMAFCRQQLSPIKCPRSIDFEAELPRHPTGKLYKRLLRDRYWAGHTSRIA
ncbi:acyl-CoA synthetase [Phreatobacter aquaticus]|uniref:Acyl-CoA synthetase n=1 Tax=Phreatobacter aquaticus TaxID=2570229 RepID=A0A4D7QLC2_9HYPH|nr:acyl-CoA synthetase [Phreatobacter aquaticus]QCK86803.1 acyl-CoA synthetase [Phreatobacter aquaticus]